VVNYARIVAGLGFTPAIGEGNIGNGDLNGVTRSGMYRTSQPVNGPSGIEWGQLLVVHGASDTIAQILFSPTDGRCWIRSGNPASVGGVGGWSPWRPNVDADFLAGAVFQVNGAFMQRNGHHLFGPDNDGAGSGLDADLLRGLTPEQVVNFVRIVAGLGFTPANRAGQNFSGSVSVDPGNVISVNADATRGGAQLSPDFDGRSGYLNLFAPGSIRVGYVGYALVGGAIGYVNDHGGGHAFYGGQITRDGAKVWDAANDGAGSGLDADLLDGRHASDFALMSGFESGANANGYWRKTPDGVIEQWGVVAGTFPEGLLSRDFPIPFTIVESISVQITGLNPTGAVWNDMWVQTANPTLTTFTPVFQATSSGNQGFGFHWRAIGR